MKRPYRLSATFIARISEPGRYGDGRGGNGLSLLVKRTAGGDMAKSWAQRLHVSAGEYRSIGIGAYPIVNLTEARRLAADNAAAVRRGEAVERAIRRTVPTVAEAMELAIAIHASGWKPGSKTEKQWRTLFAAHVLPRFGRRSVADMTAADVLAILAPIAATKPETARKLRQRIGLVMKWAMTQGHRTDDPTAAVGAALPRNGKPTDHHRALPHGEVAAALATIRQSQAWPATKLAIEFLTLTATRSGEVRGARWSEVDLEARTWTVPADRTKTGAEHRVPLSGRAVAILSEARELSDGSGLVFPSVRGRALSDSTLSKLIRELGIPCVPHGFRSSFRDWCGARSVDREVAEAALAHSRPGVEAAYHRSDLFERRAAVMDRWSQHCTGTAGKVVRLAG